MFDGTGAAWRAVGRGFLVVVREEPMTSVMSYVMVVCSSIDSSAR